MFKAITSLVDHMLEDNRILTLFIIINIFGSLFGVYFYWEQFMMTPWYLLIFVPDCPLYTFFMIFALAGIIMGKMSDTFNTVTAIGLSMYGVWTMLVLLYFPEFYFRPDNFAMSSGLFISHSGMAIESVLLLPYLKNVNPVAWVVSGAWFLIQTAMDYLFYFTSNGLPMRTHPLAISEYYFQGSLWFGKFIAKIDTVMYVTFAMAVLFPVLIYTASKLWPQKEIRENKAESIVRI